MSDVARFGVAIDASGAKTGQREFERSVDSIKAKAGEGSNAVEGMNRSINAGTQYIRQFAAFAGVSFGVRALIQYADGWKQMEGQLRLVTKSSAEAADVQAKLFKLAQDTRAPLSETVSLYARMARSTKTLGLSQDELLDITRAVNMALVISGSSAASAGGSMLQLGQAFASGTLRGDELNSILEGMPRLAEAIASGMGRSTGELRKLGAQGKITSEEMARAILNQAKVISEEYAKMPQTIGQSFTKLSNAVQKWVGESDKSIGASNAVVAVFNVIADNVDKVANALAVAGVAYASKYAAKMVVAAGEWIVASRLKVAAMMAETAEQARLAVGEEIATAASLNQARAKATQAGLAVANATSAKAETVAMQMLAVANAEVAIASNAAAAASVRATAAMAATTIGARAATAAMGVLNGVMAFFGGPIGLAITAVTIGLTVLYGWWNKKKAAMEQTKKAADELKQSMALLEAEMGKSLLTLAKSTQETDRLYDVLKTKGLKAYEQEKKNQEVLKTSTEIWNKTREAAGQAGKKVDDFATALSKGDKQAIALRDSVERERVSTEKLTTAIDSAKKGTESWTEKQKAHQKAVEDVQKKMKEMAETSAETRNDIDKEVAQLARLLESKKRGQQAYESTQRQIQMENEIRQALLKVLPTERDAVERLIRRKYELADAIEVENQKHLTNQAILKKGIADLNALNAKDAKEREERAKNLFSVQSELARQSSQPFENALKGIQSAFSSTFEKLFTDGIKSFDDLAKSVKAILVKMVSEIISMKIGQKLMGSVMLDDKGNPLKDASGGLMRQGGLGSFMKSTAGKMGGSALGGAFLGYEVGQMAPNKTLAALGGAAAGAAMGAKLGGPWGAVVGGVAGLVGGLFGQAKKAREAAKAMAEAQKAFNRSLSDYTAAAAGKSNSLSDALKKNSEQADALYKQANEAYSGKKNESERNRILKQIRETEARNAERLKKEAKDNIKSQLNEVSGKGYLNANSDLLKSFEENRDILKAAGADSGDALDLWARKFKMLSNSMSDAQFAEVLATLPPEMQEFAKKIRDVKDNSEEAREALRQQLEERRAFDQDLTLRELSNRKDVASQMQALWMDQKRQKDEELTAAKRLLDAGTITQEMFDRLAAVLNGELKDAMIAFMDGMRESALRFTEDMQSRVWTVLEKMIGTSFEDQRIAIQQRREVQELTASGASQTDIELLKKIQEFENSARAFDKVTQETLAQMKLAGKTEEEMKAYEATRKTEFQKIAASFQEIFDKLNLQREEELKTALASVPMDKMIVAEIPPIEVPALEETNELLTVIQEEIQKMRDIAAAQAAAEEAREKAMRDGFSDLADGMRHMGDNIAGALANL